MGKVRANTLNKKRAVEMAATDPVASGDTGGDSGMVQGLYAEWQTELYVPDPVVEVRIRGPSVVGFQLTILVG